MTSSRQRIRESLTNWFPLILAIILLVSFFFSRPDNNPIKKTDPANSKSLQGGLKKFQCYTRPDGFDLVDDMRSNFDNNESNVLSDSSIVKVNKKFIVMLHMTQDSVGNLPLVGAALDQAKNDIRSASGYYSAIGISFELSDSINIIDNNRFNVIETESELGEISQLYDMPNRINLFIIDRFGGELEGGCGFAGDYSMYMASGCVNPTSFAHESGHIFGLPHTFGGGSVLSNFTASTELADDSNCETAGDFICDTPADPYIPNDTTGIVWIENCAFV
ncbi:MAG: hypothetical protein JXR03_04875 [Cyclobacteriaceae bacterium]